MREREGSNVLRREIVDLSFSFHLLPFCYFESQSGVLFGRGEREVVSDKL